MRDVNSGWAIRYTHANVASFFFIFVYAHIARGLYYSSYREPRELVWNIGVIILIVMMAKLLWPNCFLIGNLKLIKSLLETSGGGRWEIIIDNLYPDIANNFSSSMLLPFSKARTKATLRIGPHNLDVLSIIICGMLGDWWSHIVPSRESTSVRFQIEQSISNTAYIHQLTLFLYDRGYCSSFTPRLVKKSEGKLDQRNDKTVDRFNFRLTLFTFSSLVWIHEGFYLNNNGKSLKRVPTWISDFITPLGLAHWVNQDGSRQKGQGVMIATNNFSYEDCIFLSKILSEKFGLRTSVVKAGGRSQPDQWKINIWKESLSDLRRIISPYFVPEMLYKIND